MTDSKTWKVLGDVSLDAVSEALGIDLPCEDYDTFSGLVLGTLGAIPVDGSTVEVEVAGLIVKVTEIRDHQVETAVVCLEKPAVSEKKTNE